ncbi:MAG: tRNA (adenosine(37)-N6)-threonylcarbamoyltransferase complex transferase subunit TsaD [Fimbriimonas ginsengisoli]|uniref:tRNA N6-adenosine threonylcarbamoyltransferase n=1 Tax=Fimbriimonas ginsengisoli TaxID=1005039 RepID=A0A931PWC9_FIMGI|nr:tRNA (adenosine(37)-N6)-threonylcarbamoyltransferase complex transferase subunit TsaD [Fimbriimonas ginsengisoli]
MSLDWFEGPLLAIETSCDETSAAVLDGRKIWSNVVSSQARLHEKWGGVVPEAAARAHVEAILPVIEEALALAYLSLRDVRAVAATNRPGLLGALSVGLTSAKALSFSLGVPLIAVHHLEGHLLSPLALPGELPFPHACLIVSGGHTELVRVDGLGRYELIGQTLDDAAGEAFDKGARLLGLGYPGGQAIEKAAEGGDPKRYPLPRGLSGDTLDFSFSGLKTALWRLGETEGERLSVPDAAASLQEAIVSVLAERAVRAAIDFELPALTLVGGVAANLSLRSRLEGFCRREGLAFLTPPPELCTDNAAMIGLAGSLRLAAGERSGFDADCEANAALPGLPSPSF